MKSCPLSHFVVSAAAIVLSCGAFAPELSATNIVFRSGFEYSGGNPTVEMDAAALNGADDQIGTFSGNLAFGDGSNSPNLVGFTDHGGPNQFSQILYLDRPLADGSFFANMSETVPLDNTTFSFEVGTRRSRGDEVDPHAKDYDIIGLDENGNESFHLRISGHSDDDGPDFPFAGERMRVGFVSDDGNVVNYDLPTSVGDDADFDMDGTGGRFDRGEIAIISLQLEDDGFVLDFEGKFDDNGPTRTYTTEKLDYNGSASELAQIEFTFQGAFLVNGVDTTADSAFQVGFVLDNLLVARVPEPSSAVMVVIASGGLWFAGRRWLAA